MNFRDRQGLQEKAREALQGAFWDPQKLMLLYMGASALVTLAAVLLSMVIESGIAGTGGLGGLGLRTALETASQALQLGVNLLLPFWTMGYLACVLKILRGQSFGPGDLLEGFRHFGPVLRLNLFRGLYFLCVIMAGFYLSMQLYMLTPWSAPLVEALEPALLGTADVTQLMNSLSPETLAQMNMAMLPFYGILVLVTGALGLPIFYDYRLADYALLDDPKAGAMMAIRRSRAMMRGNRRAMAVLDLRFWWFYVLEALATALLYADMLLPLLGSSLPVSGNVLYLVCCALYLGAQLGLYLWKKNEVECTYAAGYEALGRDFADKLLNMQGVRQD